MEKQKSEDEGEEEEDMDNEGVDEKDQNEEKDVDEEEKLENMDKDEEEDVNNEAHDEYAHDSDICASWETTIVIARDMVTTSVSPSFLLLFLLFLLHFLLTLIIIIHLMIKFVLLSLIHSQGLFSSQSLWVYAISLTVEQERDSALLTAVQTNLANSNYGYLRYCTMLH